MDVSALGAAGDAFLILMDPFRLLMLFSGVVLGLFLGIIPGVGGLAGMALLLPFTFTMDSYAAFAMLLGMAAVVGTSDTIPAVLFGVPGTVGAQATVMDGNPMGKKGEAGRALAAAYTSSLLGGLVGAALLALTIPILRPVMMHIGSPELLALSLFGISMVAILSGKAPMRGLIAAGIGIMLSMIGADPQTGTLRWTMGQFYLWDGLPIVPMVLGLFALPELADLAIKRMAISSETKFDVKTGMKTGFTDAFKNWWLVVRCGGIGAGIGAIPGLGASVVDWIAYGHALQTEKGANKTFGTGDVRGVIAPESANNAITAGSLVPTIAFGVPGSAPMAILLSVFLIHGLVPGPEMLTKNLDVTYSMVWSVAIANILGAGLCFAFSGQLAKVALLRYTLILPVVIIFVFVGSYQSSRNWGDIYALLIFAVIGWVMKQQKWPRPPLILGFVLGSLIERYMFISFTRYGYDWLSRPVVMIVLAMSAFLIISPIYKYYRGMGGIKGMARNFSKPKFETSDLMHVAFMIFLAVLVFEAQNWSWGARVGPITIGIGAFTLSLLSLINQIFSRSIIRERERNGEVMAAHTVHMDTGGDFSDIPSSVFWARTIRFFGFLLLFFALMFTIGFLPAIPVFVWAYMRIEGKESWKQIVGQSVVISAFMYIVFDQLLHVPWPSSLLGQWIPALKIIPSI